VRDREVHYQNIDQSKIMGDAPRNEERTKREPEMGQTRAGLKRDPLGRKRERKTRTKRAPLKKKRTESK